MTTVAKLSADLYANSSGFESGLRRANSAMNESRRQWNSALSQSSRSFSAFGNHVQGSIASIASLKNQLGGLVAVTASALSVQKVGQYSDQWKELEGRLRNATDGAKQYDQVSSQLFRQSMRNGTALSANIEAYSRLSGSLKDAQKQQYNLIGITDTLAKTLVISGTKGQAASELLRQFGQAASNDFKAVGQEIGTIQDQAPRLAKLLTEAFASSGKSLKQLAEDGELSTAKVLDAVVAAKAQIDREAEGMGGTIAQSLIRLDNAFLKFIGQASLIKSGTGSVAAGISLLAENFSALAYAAGALAAVFAGRLITSLTASAVAWAANTRQVVLYQAALARMAGVSTIAATRMTMLAGATSLLSGTLALLGGPVGVAILGVLAVMATSSNAAADAQQALNQEVGDFQSYASEYMSASEDMRRQIESDVDARIEAYKQEAIALQQLATSMEQENPIYRGARKLGSYLGIDSDADDVRNTAAAYGKAIDELEKQQQRMADIRSGKIQPYGGTDTGKKKKKGREDHTAENILYGLKQENDQLNIQVGMYGRKEAAIARATKEMQIQNQLAQAGVKLTAEQQKQVDAYLNSIEKQSDKYNQLEEQTKRLEEREQNRRRAMDELGTSFTSAFEDAIVAGEKLSDVVNGLANDILRLLVRKNITEPLVSGLSSDGGIFDQVGSFLFGGIPSHATGISNVPRDMLARVHKGETIIPASEAAAMRRGAGGGDLVVHITNNAGARVSTSTSDGPNGPSLEVLIDQAVADNISRAGSRTNQALNARNNRALIRR